jgi:outer membrane protein TolC
MNHTRMNHMFVFCVSLLVARGAVAQSPPDALQLGELQRAAAARDARVAELALVDEQAALRERSIKVDRLPAVSTLGQTQYQSDVPTAPFTLPNGEPAFAPAKFTYDASLRVDQRLLDPSLGARVSAERADAAESRARVQTALFQLRQDVNEAFFTAALQTEQLSALSATIEDLEARLREVAARVREGTALAGEAGAVEATLLQSRQRADELRAVRSAALARLAQLTGRAIPGDATLAVPDLAAAAASARASIDQLRARPEYAQFDRTREKLARQQELSAALEQPQVSAFGRAGYGRPGLNFISDHPEAYALGGIQLQWKAWTWGGGASERSALALQQQIVGAEEQAFTSSLRRAVELDLASIDRLQTALTTDERIVALRDGIDRAARLRLQEGVTTAADYVDRQTELLAAQVDRARHRIELAQTRARLLTTLGLEVQ